MTKRDVAKMQINYNTNRSQMVITIDAPNNQTLDDGLVLMMLLDLVRKGLGTAFRVEMGPVMEVNPNG